MAHNLVRDPVTGDLIDEETGNVIVSARQPPPIQRPADLFPLQETNVGPPLAAVPRPDQTRLAEESTTPIIAAAASPNQQPGVTSGTTDQSSGGGGFKTFLDILARVGPTFGAIGTGLASQRGIGRGLGQAAALVENNRRFEARQDIAQQGLQQAATREKRIAAGEAAAENVRVQDLAGQKFKAAQAKTKKAQNLAERKFTLDQRKFGHAVAQDNLKAAESDPLEEAQAFRIPGGGTALSYDGGITFGIDRATPVPSDAVPISSDIAAKVARRGEAIQQAQAELGRAEQVDAVTPGGVSAAEVAAREGGTGLWSNITAGFDAVVGAVTETNTLIPATQDNRQYLRQIRQLIKPALLNSSRAPIYEQKLLEKILPDPGALLTSSDIEARKIPGLIRLIKEERRFNTEEIASGRLDLKEINKLRKSNSQINRALALLDSGPPNLRLDEGGGQITTPQTKADFDALPSGATFIDPDSGERRRKK